VENETKKLLNSESAVILIRADTIGWEDEDLGSDLMVNFIYNLSKGDSVPDVIVMINTGVNLVVEGSEVLDELKELEGKGVKILACGTCLRYFNLEDGQKVGAVSNMPEITTTLMSASRVITV
jgi:selenium metabolism protein YedF